MLEMIDFTELYWRSKQQAAQPPAKV
jgi:hypothetical protein